MIRIADIRPVLVSLSRATLGLPCSSMLTASAFFLASFWSIPGATATITVTTLSDSEIADGGCSLREAIVAANTDTAYVDCDAGLGPDEINIVASGTVTLGSTLPEIISHLTIRGLGTHTSVIEGSGGHGLLEFQLSGGDGTRLQLEDLRLTSGSGPSGAALLAGSFLDVTIIRCQFDNNHATGDGGAISAPSSFRLTIDGSSFIDNTAGSSGGAVAVGRGQVTITGSTFHRNQSGLHGGGLYAFSTETVSLTRSTFEGNQAAADGGGLAFSGGTVEINSSTLTGNLADSDLNDSGEGGGVSSQSASVSVHNTVIALNSDASPSSANCPDIYSTLSTDLLSGGFNFIGTNECVSSAFPADPNPNNDQVGVPGSVLDPLLDPIADYGGATQTRRPITASPLVDQGECPLDPWDQRQFAGSSGRIVDDPMISNLAFGCDIGSFELGGTPSSGTNDSIFEDGFETGDTTAWSEVSA